MEKKKAKFRYILLIVIAYLLIGFVYGMRDEFRLAKKYGHSPFSALLDPYAYLRAAISSPLWPYDLYWALYYRGNPIGHSFSE